MAYERSTLISRSGYSGMGSIFGAIRDAARVTIGRKMADDQRAHYTNDGYNGFGDAHTQADLVAAYKQVKPFGDISLTDPTTLAVIGAAAYFLLRKKKR